MRSSRIYIAVIINLRHYYGRPNIRVGVSRVFDADICFNVILKFFGDQTRNLCWIKCIFHLAGICKYKRQRCPDRQGDYRKQGDKQNCAYGVLAEVEKMQLGKEKFIAAVRKFMQMDRLSAPLFQELIDRIDVYEVTGTGKNRKQMIKIHYKFVGYLELPSLARQHNYREETRKGVAVEYVPNALPA